MFFVNVNLSEKTQVTFFNVLVRVSLKLIKNVFRVCLPIFFYSDRVTDSPPYKRGGGVGGCKKPKAREEGMAASVGWPVCCVMRIFESFCRAHLIIEMREKTIGILFWGRYCI